MKSAYKSIFAVGSAKERAENFETYFAFSRGHAGDIIEADQDLTRKREKLKFFQNTPVRSRKPLADPDLFYRNYVDIVDNMDTCDRKTLLLTAIYKFARHEWVGISGAWDATPDIANSVNLVDKISRYH